MKMKPLGSTDIMVSEICLGTMTWGCQNTQTEAFEQLDYAVNAGINFIDTAEGYAIPMTAETFGKTETIIGHWLKNRGARDKLVLASKISGGGRQEWIRGGEAPNKGNIRGALEDSLTRLQTDYLDLYQIHWPSRPNHHFGSSWAYDAYNGSDNRDAIRDNMLEVLEEAQKLVQEGKIRHIGLSNETVWGTMQWLQLAEKHNLPRVVSMQNEYSLLQRHYDLEMAELTRHEQVGLLAYSPLAAGVLTGKYLDGPMPEGSRGAISGSAFWRNNEYSSKAVKAYKAIAEKHELDLAQMALAFTLSRPFMNSVIIGATNMSQLEANVNASALTLSQEVLSEIGAVYREMPRPL